METQGIANKAVGGNVVLSVGDCVRQRWESLESTGTVMSVQPSFTFGESVQCCEVAFQSERRWILSLNLVRVLEGLSCKSLPEAKMFD
jgi:hypothetical protein